MKLFLSSLILILVELVLIRWLGTQISVFAYLQNVLLICCFIGFGIGLGIRKLEKPIDAFLVPFAVCALLVSLPFTKDQLNQISLAVSAFGGSFVAWNVFEWGDVTLVYVPSLVFGLVLIFVMMLLTALVCLPLGTMLGARFESSQLSPLRNYSLNLLGGLAGVWIFNLVSHSGPPFVWCLVIVVLAGIISRQEGSKPGPRALLLMVCIPLIAWIGGMLENGRITVWSPYQKLTILDVTAPPAAMEGQYILVNNSGYQIMLDLRPETLSKRPELYSRGWEGYTHYDLPFRFNPAARSAVILGAGSGNDAAGAARAGLTDITAVDIDPTIIALGKSYHPEAPYGRPDSSSPVKAHAVTADARAFLAATERTYDVISFGLLDSHTTGQMMNSRLDHFVYTREAVERAATRLTPNGIMTLTFEASKPYISDRMRRTLRNIFSTEPLALKIPSSPYGFGGVMFVVGNQEVITHAIDSDPKLAALVAGLKYDVPELNTAEVTDDWPYIYLERPFLPFLFVIVALLSLLLVYVLTRQFGNVYPLKSLSWVDGGFFFLGSGFLLLETISISRSAIVLGSSWQPTAAIITGVFIMALAANATVPYIGRSLWAGMVLLASCAFLYFFDFSILLTLPYEIRFIATAVIACVPLYFSGIVFSKLFSTVADQPRALAMNLMGAVVGTTLQSLSFLWGMSSLLIVIACFYAAALTCVYRAESTVSA